MRYLITQEWRKLIRKNMDFYRLERNIIDLIEEQQLKLGYLKETIRLYYPLASLNNFLGKKCDEDEMRVLLQQFSDKCQGELGKVGITNSDERFCLAIPPEGAEYVHNRFNKNGFLAQLIDAVRNHSCTLEQLLEIFNRHSKSVHMEKMSNGEFDYLIYFEDGKPDNYRYCVVLEGNHVTYHRYTPEDYKDFGF